MSYIGVMVETKKKAGRSPKGDAEFAYKMALWLSGEALELVDGLIDQLQKERGVKSSRTDITRLAIDRGLAVLKKEWGMKGK